VTSRPSRNGWTSLRPSTATYVLPAVLVIAAAALGQDLPVPQTHVADHANLIDPQTEAALDAILTELERKTTAQVVVLTVKTTSGTPIEQYALAVAERWQLGQKGKDNGLLIVVASADREYRFETGYGLESIVPDSYCGSVGRQYFVPAFRRGRYGEGIYQGTQVIAQQIAKAHNVQLSAAPAVPAGRRARGPAGTLVPCCTGMFPLLLFTYVFLSVLRSRRRGLMFWGLPILLGSMGGRGHGSSFGGGGFGSLGGGGGGSFGGGGASGSGSQAHVAQTEVAKVT